MSRWPPWRLDLTHHLPALSLVLVAACSDKSSDAAGADADADDGGGHDSWAGGDRDSGGGWDDGGTDDGSAGSDAECTASFSWYQKDAYAVEAGRSSDLWPPHTTTAIEFQCEGDENGYYSSMANHGAEVDAQDDAGNWILDLVGYSDDLVLTESELLALTDAYEQCDCEAFTNFLSMAALQDEAVQAVVGSLVELILEHLECSGQTDAETLVYDLQAGELDLGLEALPYCTWDGGYDWQSALSEAFSTAAAEMGEALADFHVCNNDAMVQWELFDGYASDSDLGACEAAQSLCYGPEFFYVVD